MRHTDWQLPGYDVERWLGSGSTGEVWRAREQVTGDVVALKRLHPEAPPEAVDALVREAAVLRALDTPYVVRLRAVVEDGDEIALVLDYAGGGSLADLLSRRGRLDPGEVVTVAAPLAQALAVAHAQGVVHGDLTPANVLFSPDGMPLLADLGWAHLAGEPHGDVMATAEFLDPAVAAGAEPTPASDVWSLAAVCHAMLVGEPPHEGEALGEVLGAAVEGYRAPLGLLAPDAPRALVDVVEAALSLRPDERPDAAAFASLVRRAFGAAPVRLHEGEHGGERGGGSRTRATHAVPRHEAPRSERSPTGSLHRLVPVAFAVLLLVVAATVGWRLGRSPATPVAVLPAAAPSVTPGTPSVTPATPSVTPAAVDWRVTLEALDAERATAFALGDVRRLARVYVAGSPALVADTEALDALVAQRQVADGVRHTFTDVEPVSVDEEHVVLRVVDEMPGYVVRDDAGEALRDVPARGSRGYQVELERTSDGWRIASVAG